MFAGQYLDEYRLEERINDHPLRQVWAATGPRGPVILKIIPLDGDPQVTQMIEAERLGSQAQDVLYRRDQGRHIPRVYPHATSDSFWYGAMERVDGTPLHQCSVRKGEALRLILELARCLAEWQGTAAQPVVVHGDLKPSNLLRGRDGRLWVVDFGAARILENGPAPDLLCTRPYGSPERLESGTIDAAADRWSLMVVFYELLAGHRPFEPPALTPRPPEIPGLERTWYAVLAKGLELDPAKRYVSAEALLSDLEALAAGLIPAALSGYDVTECVARPAEAPAWISRARVWLPVVVFVLYHIPILYSGQKLAQRIQSGRIGLNDAYDEYVQLRRRAAAPIFVASPGRALSVRLEAAVDRDLRQSETFTVNWSADAQRLERMRSIDPANPNFWMKTEIVAGRTALTRGDAGEAIRRFRAASLAQASAPDPYLELARLYATIRPDPVRLLDALEQARLRKHILNANDHILLGRAYLGEGDAAPAADHARATDRYRRALKQFQQANNVRLERLARHKLRQIGE